ncbi:MAG: hypothetical protein DRN29_04830 [Thermoplasmata archaeon]|nr:MAG: hypothetical protein DRN29_04830 [Thermoplasmata archaeon]
MWGTVYFAHKTNPSSPFVYICALVESGALITKKDIKKKGKKMLIEHKKEFLQDIIDAAQRELQKLDSQ